jgi:hypothetical protein
VPMMKLTFTLRPNEEAAKSGLEVDKACGG